MKNKTDNLKLEEFFGRLIDSYIVNDILKLIQVNEMHQTSYPYLALAFSGIDFFGGLKNGFKRNNSRERSCWFIKEWMGKTNTLYSNEHLIRLIYNSCRNGIFHNAVLKNTFTVSSFLYPKSQHLHLIVEKGLIFFHSIQFAEDFLEAQKKYRKHISSSKDSKDIKRLYENLSEMVQENLNQNHTDMMELIRELKLNKQTMNQKIQPVKDNTVTNSFVTTETDDITWTKPPSWDE